MRTTVDNITRRVRLSGMLVALVCVVSPVLASTTEWFTIVGDPRDPHADTIQMDPVARKAEGALRVMGLRVSRSMVRTSSGGASFRSYEGTVEFDCDKLSARFVRSQFYDEPLWKSPGALVDFPPSSDRPMAFRLFEPNPRERVIRAACQGYRK